MPVTAKKFPVQEFDLPWFDGTTHHYVFAKLTLEGFEPNEPISVGAQEFLPNGTPGMRSTWPQAVGGHADGNGVWEESMQISNSESTVELTGGHDVFSVKAEPAG